MTFRDDRDALLARNDALEREVADAKRALAEKERELEGLKNPATESGERDEAQEPAQVTSSSNKRANARTARTGTSSLVPRILSVFTQAWVIVVFGFPAVFAIIAFATVPGARLILGSALLGYAALVVLLDAFLRRCPSCRRWLAGIFLRVVRDQYDFHVTSWRCTFCQHNWQSQRYAGPR